MKVSVVIPVFNDASMLPVLLARLAEVGLANHYSFDVIIVDDGSTNARTWPDLKHIKNANSNQSITLVRLRKNCGQHIATLVGLRQSRTEWAVTMDADLQHPPEEIPKLLYPLAQQDYELVYGTAALGHSLPYRILSGAFKLVTHKYNNPVDRKASSFRAMKTRLVHQLGSDFPFVLIDTDLQEKSLKTVLVNTEHHHSPAGQSSYSRWKRIRLALSALVSGKSFYRPAILASAGIGAIGILHNQGGETPHFSGYMYISACFLSLLFLVLLFKRQKHHLQNDNTQPTEIIR